LPPTAFRDKSIRRRSRFPDRYGAAFDVGECKWLAKPIVIRLWYLYVLGETPSLHVVFRKAGDDAYDF
jgi:hypothetical protein